MSTSATVTVSVRRCSGVADRNAGFSQTNPQQLYLPLITDHEYHHETVHVEAQQHNPHSLLQWMKRLIALRKRFKAFGRGDLTVLQPENRKVLAFLRHHDTEAHSRRRQLVTVSPARPARSGRVSRAGAGRAVWPDGVSDHWGAAVPAHVWGHMPFSTSRWSRGPSRRPL